jgi:DNA-directed RNA polymerase specialized sigma24 family protein
MIADVSRALDAYGRNSDRVRYVFRHEVLGETFTQIAQAEGVSYGTAHTRHAEVLNWLSGWLNGSPGED